MSLDTICVCTADAWSERMHSLFVCLEYVNCTHSWWNKSIKGLLFLDAGKYTTLYSLDMHLGYAIYFKHQTVRFFLHGEFAWVLLFSNNRLLFKKIMHSPYAQVFPVHRHRCAECGTCRAWHLHTRDFQFQRHRGIGGTRSPGFQKLVKIVKEKWHKVRWVYLQAEKLR